MEECKALACGALAGMPTIKYQFAPAAAEAAAGSSGAGSHSQNEAMSVYVLPPIQYPGKGFHSSTVQLNLSRP